MQTEASVLTGAPLCSSPCCAPLLIALLCCNHHCSSNEMGRMGRHLCCLVPIKPAKVKEDRHVCSATCWGPVLRCWRKSTPLLTLSTGLPVDTPMWRPGPMRRNELCNACGIKWRRHHQRPDTLLPSAPSPAVTVSNSQAEVQVRANLTDS